MILLNSVSELCKHQVLRKSRKTFFAFSDLTSQTGFWSFRKVSVRHGPGAPEVQHWSTHHQPHPSASPFAVVVCVRETLL